MDNESRNNYEQDLAIIKDILLENSERPVLEYWAFYIWGILTLAGTFLSVKLYAGGWTSVQLFWRVWIPVLIAGSLGESVAWIVKSAKESIPLLNKIMIRFFLSSLGVIFAFFFVIILLLFDGKSEILIKLILPLLSVVFFLYSTVTYRFINWFGYLSLALGLIFLLFLPPAFIGVVSGVVSSVLLIVAGIGVKIKERSKTVK